MVNVTYTNDIPLATNNPSQDQPDMKINTNAVDTILNVDHVSFNTNAGGTHKQCQITSQTSSNGAIPSGLLGAGFETLYASLTSGVGDLWMVRGAEATGIRLTGASGGNITPVATTSGYTFLAGGIVVQWGQVTGIATATHVSGLTNFNVTFPNACFFVYTTPVPVASGVTSQATIGVANSSTTNFGWVYNKETGTSYTKFNWFAIGN